MYLCKLTCFQMSRIYPIILLSLLKHGPMLPDVAKRTLHMIRLGRFPPTAARQGR